MIWLNTLALVGLAAIAAPILIHILVQRRATPFPFPTLRFLRPTRLAAIRRRVLDDLPLLVVRGAVLTAAAGALAGPLLLTPARRAAWNARIARAIVLDRSSNADRDDLARPSHRSQGRDRGAESPAPRATATAFRAETFDASDLRDGIARASAWLDAAPPAKRELVIVSPFALGSIAWSDVNKVPHDVGTRLIRSGQLPESRSVAAPAVLYTDLGSADTHQRDRSIELNGPATSVRESVGSTVAVPLEIVATAEVKRAAEATLRAVLSQRVFPPVPGRCARIVFASSTGDVTTPAQPLPPWIADAIARITTDEELQWIGDDPRPWFTASSDGAQLVVTTTRLAGDIRTAILFRSILSALAPEDIRRAPARRSSDGLQPSEGGKALAEREILTILDADLRAWERPAADLRSPRLETIADDDRRWWWGAVLVLLAVEALTRRTRHPRRAHEEISRVA